MRTVETSQLADVLTAGNPVISVAQFEMLVLGMAMDDNRITTSNIETDKLLSYISAYVADIDEKMGEDFRAEYRKFIDSFALFIAFRTEFGTQPFQSHPDDAPVPAETASALGR